MKTTQILAAVFPLAVMATSDGLTGTVSATSTSEPSTVTVTATNPGEPGTATATSPFATSSGSGSAMYSFKDLGCYHISPDKTGENRLAPDERPSGYSGSNPFNSKGTCAVNLCNTFKYAATQGNKCFCADEIDSTLIHITDPDEIKDICNIGCPGYDLENCGGPNAIFIYENEDLNLGEGYSQLTGSATSVPTASGATNGTSTKTGAAPVTTKTGPAEAGASALVGQSITMILAVCGVGAALFL